MYQRLHIISNQEWLDEQNKRHEWQEKNYPDRFGAEMDRFNKTLETRKELAEKFPYVVTLRGNYPEHDYASQFCWQNFGPPNCEQCHDYCSEFPACPIVLESKLGWHDPNRVADCADKDIVEHGHEGIWTAFWLGKTGYDFGSSDYCFQNQTDLDRFLAAIPVFTFGENEEEK